MSVLFLLNGSEHVTVYEQYEELRRMYVCAAFCVLILFRWVLRHVHVRSHVVDVSSRGTESAPINGLKTLITQLYGNLQGDAIKNLTQLHAAGFTVASAADRKGMMHIKKDKQPKGSTSKIVITMLSLQKLLWLMLCVVEAVRQGEAVDPLFTLVSFRRCSLLLFCL